MAKEHAAKYYLILHVVLKTFSIYGTKQNGTKKTFSNFSCISPLQTGEHMKMFKIIGLGRSTLQ